MNYQPPRLIIVTALIALTAAALNAAAFTSIDELGKWLSAQPANTADKPYTITLNVPDLTGIANTLNTNKTKYVNLDLFGNTFTSIGHETFYNCASLTSVIIPNSVTSIGNYAFHSCNKLVSITIPASVTSIGRNAFGDCSSLTSVTIPAGVTSIMAWSFSYCDNLTSITIPAGVTNIGEWAFLGCASLTNVTIPAGVTSIKEEAFSRCSNLTAINVAAQNTAYTAQDGILYNKNKTTVIKYPEGKNDGAFVIPDSVTSIGVSAFENCVYLSGVTIPAGVTSIGVYAFGNCKKLTGITIPAGVTTIGIYAFSYCNNLTSATFNGTVDSRNFGVGHDKYGLFYSSFNGDLHEIFYATDKTNGTPGTYTTTTPVGKVSKWTKKT